MTAIDRLLQGNALSGSDGLTGYLSLFATNGTLYGINSTATPYVIGPQAGGGGSVTSVTVLAPIPGLSVAGNNITTSGTITITGTLGHGAGGTGLGATPTNGQTLLGNGSGYTLGTLTAGAGMGITNSAGGVTIASTEWTSTGTLTHLVTSTRNVTVGGATDIGKLGVVGDADEIQLRVRAHSSQSAYLASFEDSGGNQQVVISGNGDVIINEEGNDADFRVETDGNANALFVDGGNNNVGIGTNAPDSDTILDVVSTTKASRPFPTMDSTQRDAIASPATASVIYNSTTTQYEYYTGSAWAALGGSSFLSPSPQLLMNTLATKTVVQGTWANTVNGSQMYGNLYTNISAVAINDEFEFEMALAAGTYTFKLLSLKDNTSGIVTVSIDGGNIGTIDLYSAGGAVNQVNSITSIVIAATGTKTINFKMASKNASSSNYVAYVTMVQFIKTA